MEELKSELHALNVENQRLQVQLSESIRLVRSEYEAKLKQSAADRNDREEHLQQEVRRLLGENEKKATEMDRLSATIQELTSAKEDLRAQLKAGKTVHQEFSSFKQDLELMGEQNSALQAQLADAKKQLRNAEDRVRNAGSTVRGQLDSDLEDKTAQLDALKLALRELTNQLQAKDDELSRAQDAYRAVLQTLPADAQQAAATLQADTALRTERLEQEAAALRDRIGQLERQVAQGNDDRQQAAVLAEQRVAELQKAADEARDTAQTAQEAHAKALLDVRAECDRRVQLADEAMAEARAEAQARSQAADEAQAKLEQLERDCQADRQRAQQAEMKLRTLAAHTKRLQETAAQNKQASDDQAAAARAAETRAEEAAAVARERDHAANAAQQLVARLQSTADEATAELAEVRAQLHETQQRLNEASILLSDRQLYINQVEELSGKKSRLESAQAVTDDTIHSLMAQIENLSVELEHMRTTCVCGAGIGAPEPMASSNQSTGGKSSMNPFSRGKKSASQSLESPFVVVERSASGPSLPGPDDPRLGKDGGRKQKKGGFFR